MDTLKAFKTRARAAAGGCIALGAALVAGAVLADTTRSPDATATSAVGTAGGSGASS